MAKPKHLSVLRKLYQPKKGGKVPTPTSEHSTKRPYRDAQTIADIAIVEAQRREENLERGGQLYMLGEILTALHRKAETLELIASTLNQLNDHTQSRLPPPQHAQKPFDDPDNPR